MLQKALVKSIGTSAFLAMCLTESSFAYAPYLNNFIDHYQTNEVDVSSLIENQSCGLCHVSKGGGGRRNAYGQDFDRITLDQRAGFNGIEMLDSDNDSFTNLEEIFLQAHPGKDQILADSRLEIDFDEDDGLLTIDSDQQCSSLEITAFGTRVAAAESSFSDEAGPSMLSLDDVTFPAMIMIEQANGVVLAKCGNHVGSYAF